LSYKATRISGPGWAESKFLYYSILFFWLIINLIQSGFTELIHDEAYYYYYAANLSWGYFDHPPMIALFIKLGTMLSSNEWGVRLLICVSSVITMALVIKLANVRNYLLFFVLWFSVLIIHVGGFVAVPDVPLIFISILFFVGYRNYLDKQNWQNILFVAISIAMLFYTKYTGILVVFFTVLSNLKLIKQKAFWLIVLLVIVLMIPHLIWQIKHDFVTPYYHLVERNTGFHFTWQNVIEYITGQIGILNPFVAFILIYFGLTFKPADAFDKALKYNAFGVLILGLIMSFRSHVEANWTSTAIIPLLIIAYQEIENKRKIIKTIYILGSISAVLIIVLRSLMIINYLPAKYKHHFRVEFHDWDTWANEINEKAGKKPVAFINSYQRASKYYYYANDKTYTFSTCKYRLNEFDVRGVEKQFLGDSVMFFHNDEAFGLIPETLMPIPGLDSMNLSTGEKLFFTTIKDYRTYNFLKIEFNTLAFRADEIAELPIEIINKTGTPVVLESDSLGVKIAVVFYQKGEVVFYEEVKNITGIKIEERYQTRIKVKIPEQAGEYYFRVVLRSGWLPPGLNSRIQKITVAE
jgi:hypothetical protein